MRISILVAIALASCGASTRETTIHATLVGVDAARDAFLVFDAKHEEDIKKSATSEASAHAALLAWRTQSDRVMGLVTDALRAIAVAATSSDDASLASMLKAAALIDATITEAEKP